MRLKSGALPRVGGRKPSVQAGLCCIAGTSAGSCMRSRAARIQTSTQAAMQVPSLPLHLPYVTHLKKKIQICYHLNTNMASSYLLFYISFNSIPQAKEPLILSSQTSTFAKYCPRNLLAIWKKSYILKNATIVKDVSLFKMLCPKIIWCLVQ